jgi:hypothetical protein
LERVLRSPIGQGFRLQVDRGKEETARGKVVVVDDDHDVLSLLTSILSRESSQAFQPVGYL